MSHALDANVLLYASDAASRFHDRARRVVDRCAEGPELCCLPWPVIMAYLRISTHPSIFEQPLAPREAVMNIESLLNRPHVRSLGEIEGFWEMYRHTTNGVVVRGNLVPDAHIATLLFQHGVMTLWTHDRDFRKFAGLQIRDPFADADASA